MGFRNVGFFTALMASIALALSTMGIMVLLLLMVGSVASCTMQVSENYSTKNSNMLEADIVVVESAADSEK